MTEPQTELNEDQVVATWLSDVEASETTTLPESEEAFGALGRQIESRASDFHALADHAVIELESRHTAARESQEELTKALYDVQVSLKAVGDRCKNACDELDGRFDTLESGVTDAAAQIEKWEAECGQTLDAYSEALRGLRMALEQTEDEVEAELTTIQGEAEAQATAAAEALTGVAGDLHEFGEHLGDQVDALGDSLVSVTSSTDEQGREFDRETRSRHDVTLQALTAILQQQPLQALGEWDARAGEALSGLGGNVTASIEQFDSGVGHLLEPVAPILDTVEKIKPVLETVKALL